MSRTTNNTRTTWPPEWGAGAHHWKTATFGWLAFVVVAFGLGGMARHEEDRQQHGRPGRVRPDGPDPRRWLQTAGGRDRPRSRAARLARHIRVPRRDRRRRRRCLGVRLRPARPLAARTGNGARSRRRARRAGASSTSAATKDDAVDKIDPVVDAWPQPRRPTPGFFVGEFGDASAEKESRGPSPTTREGGHALAADDARHPGGRLRKPRRGGHPAPARADRRLRDVRAHRDPELLLPIDEQATSWCS